jgi:hypothetical protein
VAAGMSRIAAQLLAPSSLSLEPGEDADSPHERSVLLPGDLVLLKTPGVVYSGFRQLSSFEFDHVVVALSRPDHCLHISPPKARRVRAVRLLTSDRSPMVLRPHFESQSERETFVHRCEKLLDADYNLSKLYGMVARNVLEKQFKVGRFLPKASAPSPSDSSWLCTDAILVCLMESSTRIKRVCTELRPQLDFFRTGSASMSDLMRLSSAGVLDEIPIIVANTGIGPVSTAEKLKQAWDEAGRTQVSLRTIAFALMISSLFNRRLFFARMMLLLTMLILTASVLRSSPLVKLAKL